MARLIAFEIAAQVLGASALELLIDVGAGVPSEGRLSTSANFETQIPGEGAQTIMVRGHYRVKNER